MGEVRNGDQKVRKYLFSEIFYGRQTVSYEEIFPGNFGVGGIKNILGKKNVSYENFLAQEILARILPAEEILKPKISWRQEEILRGNFWIT